MIYFFSGTPGSGKSLHVAKMIDQWHRRGRNIIANFEVNEHFWDKKHLSRQADILEVSNDILTVDFLLDYADKKHERNEKGQIKEKQTLLVIDECQTMFNSRSWNQRGRSQWVVFFTQHRKFGYEVVLISQHKDLVDKQIRNCFEYNYVHRNIKNFKFFGWLLSRFIPGKNFIVVSVTWMTTGKHDHANFLFGMKRYFSLYDSYKIFDTKNLRQLSPAAGPQDGVRGPDVGAGGGDADRRPEGCCST